MFYVCVLVHHVPALFAEARKGHWTLGTGVADDFTKHHVDAEN